MAAKTLFETYHGRPRPNFNLTVCRLFSENIDMFGFEDCSFVVQKSKESTGRVVMWKEFQLVNSFTLEASFLGPNKGVNAGLHFNPTHL